MIEFTDEQLEKWKKIMLEVDSIPQDINLTKDDVEHVHKFINRIKPSEEEVIQLLTEHGINLKITKRKAVT